MKGSVSLHNGDQLIATTELNETIEFDLTTECHVTHIMVEAEGYKRLKYVNGSMPFLAHAGATIRFNNFIAMLENSGAMEHDGTQTNIVS
jgi:hypothetical protein